MPGAEVLVRQNIILGFDHCHSRERHTRHSSRGGGVNCRVTLHTLAIHAQTLDGDGGGEDGDGGGEDVLAFH